MSANELEKAIEDFRLWLAGRSHSPSTTIVRTLITAAERTAALEKENAELHRFIERVAEHDLTSKDCGAGCLEELVRDAAILATPRQEDGRCGK